MDRLARRTLARSDFGAELDTAAKDTAIIDVCADWWVFEIGSGVSLSGMRCEGASVLCLLIAGEIVAEVVVLFLVLRDGEVVFRRGEIDGCSCAWVLGFDHEEFLGSAERATYRSSNDPQSGPQEAHCRGQAPCQELGSASKKYGTRARAGRDSGKQGSFHLLPTKVCQSPFCY